MPRGRLAHLVRGGEMDEAVAHVHGRAVEPARSLGRAPFGLLEDLEKESHAGRTIEALAHLDNRRAKRYSFLS